jgi:probable rRNA maturation factor
MRAEPDLRGGPKVERPVAIANRHPRLRLDRAALTRAIRELDRNHDRLATPASTLGNSGELSLVFLTDAALAQLHGDFLADPTTTDVITFEGDAALGFAGEICVSVDTARAYARANRRDFSEELLLYVVHGWLHLAGHDDLAPTKKRAMRRGESRALKLLRAAGSLPKFVWQSAKAQRS